MPLYRPSELQAFLKSSGYHPLKSLSQNFLIDGNVVAKIVTCAELKAKEPVLEIGPGPGVLTEHISKMQCPVLAVEKDGGFAERIGRFENVVGIHADALKLDLHALVRSHFPNVATIRVISSLPYRVASEFLCKLLPEGAWIKSLTLLLPVAIHQKLCGILPPHWLRSAFSIFCRSKTEQKVRKNSFFPVPKSDSVLVHWELIDRVIAPNGQAFLHWLAAMHQRRHQALKKTLRAAQVPQLAKEFLESSGKWPLAFPPDLQPLEWFALWKTLN